ncbi:MAG: fatty acid desaturase, partial [Elusimicrobia bacterium]|nr:fatty acid desaturase [Elusimicrobiota bacterium]
KILQLFYLIFGAAAVENSALNWTADHRNHHRFVDTDAEPYNINRGGFYAHMGWICYRDSRDPKTRYQSVPDLLKDPLLMWQHRWYLAIVIVAGFVFPAVLGHLAGRPLLAGLLWGGFLRVTLGHHMTFLINSAAHLWGKRPYSLDNSARDNWVLAPLTFGEGYHNFHHKFPSDWRNGVRWYQFDMTKWWLALMRPLGLVSNLRRTPEPHILKARLQVELAAAKNKISAAEPTWRAHWGERIHESLEAAKTRVEAAMERYHQATLERARHAPSPMRQGLESRLEAYRTEFLNARMSWKSAMRLVNRLSYAGATKNLMTVAAILDLLKSRV